MPLLTPDTTFFTHYTDKGKYVLTWRLSVIFTGVFGLLSLSLIWEQRVGQLIYLLTFLTGLGGFIYLHRTKRYKHLYWVYAVGGTSMLSLSILAEPNTLHYPELLWVSSIVIFSFIGLERKAGLFFLLLNGCSFLTHMVLVCWSRDPFRKPDVPLEAIGLMVEMVLGLFMIGYLVSQYIRFQQYAESESVQLNQQLGEQNREVVKKNQENELLIKEIHHRVKNNLQIIISLLRMQSDEIRSEEARRHFSEATGRVMSMAMIHEKLYRERELSSIDLDRYLKDLTMELIHSFGDSARLCRCECQTDFKRVGLKTIVPFGLLINELVTNSLKHAFSEGQAGIISIRVSESPAGSLVLQYSDNGCWKETDASQESGFGVELIALLTGQMEGTCERVGGTYRFELSNMDH